jgi:hypothetical protein
MRRWRSAVIGGLIALSLLLIPLSSIAQADDWIQTTQGDFEAGVGLNIDTTSSPGNVTLRSSWNKYPSNPILSPGPAAWDSEDVDCGYVLYNGSIYKMWYTGTDGSGLERIGYATSPDGISWTKSASNPVLGLGAPGSWNDVYSYCPSLLFDGAIYHMWYSGTDGVIVRAGYATSPDGITWTPYAGNLCSGTTGNGCVLDIGPPGSWDEDGAYHPNVMFDGITYKMWYAGVNSPNERIGYATSPDGITWTKSPSNPVLDFGSPGEWDQLGAGACSVKYNGASYDMWFTGAYSGIEERIGHATSPDGITWTKNASNPVVDLGPSGSWDGSWAVYPSVIKVGPEFKMWYTGMSSGLRRIGHATLAYPSSGNLTSVVFDSGVDGTTWNSISWTESLPMGTNITIAMRSGDTATPDVSWSSWSAEMWTETGSTIVSPTSRYIQYRATFTTTDIQATPVLSDVTINYTLADATPPTISDLTEDPDPQYKGGIVGITARVTDDIGVERVSINIEGVGNYTMNYYPVSDLYHYNASFLEIGIYSYTIWAKDTSDNWDFASSSFTVIELDEKPPDDWWWILLVIIIIILIIIILFLLMRRKKKEEEEEEPAPPQLPRQQSLPPPQSLKPDESIVPPPPPPSN